MSLTLQIRYHDEIDFCFHSLLRSEQPVIQSSRWPCSKSPQWASICPLAHNTQDRLPVHFRSLFTQSTLASGRAGDTWILYMYLRSRVFPVHRLKTTLCSLRSRVWTAMGFNSLAWCTGIQIAVVPKIAGRSWRWSKVGVDTFLRPRERMNHARGDCLA